MVLFTKPDDWKPTPGITIEGVAREIVTATATSSVLAGPGAGKTELLAQRASFLLSTGQCTPPQRILAIAFKVDAARNLMLRVDERCDPLFSARFDSLTLHAFAKKLLDQFVESLPEEWRPSPDYTVIKTSRDFWDAYRDKYSEACPSLRGYRDTRLTRIVHEGVPSYTYDDSVTEEEQFRWLWWRDQLAGRSRLTFEMILCLATHILSSQPTIISALRATYSHVFLDEFQDVTGRQYELIQAAFLGSNATLTAVGDTNQAIMGFAGARPDIFNRYDDDFGAETKRLLHNYRSNSSIVALINNMAATFDPNYVPTECARMDDPVPDNPIELWDFPTRLAEGNYVAQKIAGELAEDHTLAPGDFVLLGKMKVNDIEGRLKPAFDRVGLKLRNDAREVGGIAIQDLVKEPANIFFLSCLKLSVGVREGNPFQEAISCVADLGGLDITSDKGYSDAVAQLRRITQGLEQLVGARTPAAVSGAEICGYLLEYYDRADFRRSFRTYAAGNLIDLVIAGFEEFYNECRAGIGAWSDCVVSLEGRDSVRLMTIHKSKGLEYHTVLFLELNDDAFWGNGDEVNVFFVALSRARERVYFSHARDSAGHEKVGGIIRKLIDSGVPIVRQNG